MPPPKRVEQIKQANRELAEIILRDPQYDGSGLRESAERVMAKTEAATAGEVRQPQEPKGSNR